MQVVGTAWKESCCQVRKSGLITEVILERISETSCLISRLMIFFFFFFFFASSVSFFAGEVFNFMVADAELLEAHGNHYKVSKKCIQKEVHRKSKKKKTAADLVNSWAFGKGLGFGKTGHRGKKKKKKRQIGVSAQRREKKVG